MVVVLVFPATLSVIVFITLFQHVRVFAHCSMLVKKYTVRCNKECNVNNNSIISGASIHTCIIVNSLYYPDST